MLDMNFRELFLCVLRRRFAGSPPGRPPGHAASHHPLSLGWSADALPVVGAASAPTAADNLIQSIQQTSTLSFSWWLAGGTGVRRHGVALHNLFQRWLRSGRRRRPQAPGRRALRPGRAARHWVAPVEMVSLVSSTATTRTSSGTRKPSSRSMVTWGPLAAFA